MTKRFAYNALIGFALLLLGVVMALAGFNWSLAADSRATISLLLTWFVLPLVSMLGLLALAYSAWRVGRQRARARLQSEILHSLVHEFKTPIAAIRMAADVLALPLPNGGPGAPDRSHGERSDAPPDRRSELRTEKYLRIIREETERMQHQVDTMLSLARADQDALVVSPEPVDVHQLLLSVAERHGDYVTLDLRADTPNLLADRMHLTNIVHNLLDNAVKYSVGTPEIRIGTLSEPGGLCLCISDRGIGIPPHLRQRIFQPFYRVQGPNQPSVKGFGLGLSYVQRIVQAHQWRLDLTSEVGQGSEFRIQVPAHALIRRPQPANT